MIQRTSIRGMIVLLAATTTAAGVWCVFETHFARTQAANVASSQVQLQNNLVTVARLHKDLTTYANQPRPTFVIPEKPEQSNVLRELQDIAAKASVDVASVSFTDENKLASGHVQQSSSKTGPGVKATVQATGSRDALLQFIHLVQNNQRMALVNGVQITIGNGATESQLTMQLTFPYGG